MATTTATLPPTTEDADLTAEAMQERRKIIKRLNEKYTPELRKWIVDALKSAIEKAAG